ncbi:MAG: YhbY family RNA-binding protein [Betaproteobacteria bacterium]|nr:YhbY family RNA-binding protein [Betaproteobacteria bacterium]
MKALTPAERQHLKGEAHQLNPVVLIGSDGLTPAVLKEIDLSLKAHELMKIKAASGDRADCERWLAQICSDLGAQAVQHIGKTLVIYRENPAKKVPAPKPEPKAGKPRKTKGKVPSKPARKPSAGRRSS